MIDSLLTATEIRPMLAKNVRGDLLQLENGFRMLTPQGTKLIKEARARLQANLRMLRETVVYLKDQEVDVFCLFSLKALQEGALTEDALLSEDIDDIGLSEPPLAIICALLQRVDSCLQAWKEEQFWD